MQTSPRASAAVIAAAVVAILQALFILFSSGAMILVLSSLNSVQLDGAQFPSGARPVALVFAGFFVALSVFGVITGVGLILLRNWARISILTWGGLSVFFGFFGALVVFLAPLGSSPGWSALPPGAEQTFRVTMALIYGLPTAIGLWWLILFNTKRVKEQFAGMEKPLAGATGQVMDSVPTTLPAKPRPPVFISILAWLNITTAAHVLLLPFLPSSLPVVLFGHFFTGTTGTVLYVVLCAILVTIGIGLLKLKPWSYNAFVTLQLLFLASNLVTAFSPNYNAQMATFQQKLLESMHLPAEVPIPAFSQGHWPLYFALLFSVFVLGLLLYYQRRFLDACAAAARQHSAAESSPETFSS